MTDLSSPVAFLLLLLLLPLSMACVEREREALLQFKDWLVDDHGTLSSWDNSSSSDCCLWKGVGCSNHTGHIINLHLPAPGWFENDGEDKRLRGEISPSLAELGQYLTHLDLSGNDFEGRPIPTFIANSLQHLQYLNLSYADFAGPLPSQLGNLSSLFSLDLSGNYGLGTEKLDWLSHLSSLRHLDLGYVDLSKAIHWSEAINKLPALLHLNLGYCSLPPPLTSTTPSLNSSAPPAFLDLSWNHLDLTSIYPWLFNFTTTLVHLDLTGNNDDVNGSTIPEAFGNMSSLAYFDISWNQLQGSIPEAFGNMTSLTHLYLSCNQLQGPIPGTLGSLASLEVLSLSQNELQGEVPKSLSNLCRLHDLKLQSNNLSGELPLDFLACANSTLEYLDLSQNQLRGSIPHLMGFSSLRTLDLAANNLNGTLPTSIGQLTNLHWLDIGQNMLQGAISEAHLLHLSHLTFLDLFSNSLTFNISPEWVPPFHLTSLSLTSCQLGPRFPSWLRTQQQLEVLDISNSKISDVIPNWFWNLTSNLVDFNISNNHLRGTLPNLSLKVGRVLYLDMSSNNLGGSIPQLPSNVLWLNLSNNKFSGSISSMCTAQTTYLVFLDLSNNLLYGELSICQSSWKKMILLNLENNQFFGNIPKSLGSLQSIQSLHLRNNNLNGELPSSLRKCQSLRLIDLAKNKLSGKIPPWIGESLTNLMVLNLRSNNFSGSICPKLCQLKGLQILDLSDNNMWGSIPRCISNFTAMTKKGKSTIDYNNSETYSRSDFIFYTAKELVKWKGREFEYKNTFDFIFYTDKELVKWKGREFEYKNTLGLVKSIDLSSNKLTGEIPKEVTKLIELVSLNVSRNNLTGLIPITIGQLKSLDVLDLSQNQLIGEIPSSLSGIDRLSTLDLSNNNLSGKIPRGTQLQSFKASSYDGNPALCGPPILKKCSGDRDERVSKTFSNEGHIQEEEHDIWFYVGVALGFIIGFWGVCGTLLLNTSWRYAYFRFLNRIKDWLYVMTTINMVRLQRSVHN